MVVLRWGILTAGRISHDFLVGLSTLPESDHKAVAVAARDIQSSQLFAKQHSIPKSYGSYEELVADPEIDVVYVGAINPQHFPLAKLALDNGKHVLCEKPLCMNSSETRKLVKHAKEKKLFLMEAIWSRFFPSYIKLKEEIDNNVIGNVLQVIVSFSLPMSEEDSLRLKEKGRSIILDVGIYCVEFSSWVFGEEKPLQILSGGSLNVHGVDISSSTTLIYSKGRTATLITHTKVNLPCEGIVIGTKGTLKLPNPFLCSTILETPSGTLEFPLPHSDTKINFLNSTGLSYECEEVRRCIQSGILESPIVSHKESILISEIMETIRKQVGVIFDE